MTNSYRASGRNVVGLDRPESGLTVSTSVDVPGESGNTYRSHRLSRPSSIAVGLSKWWDMPSPHQGAGGCRGSEQQVDVEGCQHGALRAQDAGVRQPGSAYGPPVMSGWAPGAARCRAMLRSGGDDALAADSAGDGDGAGLGQ